MNDFEKNLKILTERENKAWINGQGKLNDIAIREIFSMKHEINLLKDAKGMPIPGTGKIITYEEKKMVFDYILENNLPITKKMYNFILKSYIDGDLELGSQIKTQQL